MSKVRIKLKPKLHGSKVVVKTSLSKGRNTIRKTIK